jgi:hypothetical protein
VNGQSLVDVAGPMINMTRPLGAVVDGVELVLLPMITEPDAVTAALLEIAASRSSA